MWHFYAPDNSYRCRISRGWTCGDPSHGQVVCGLFNSLIITKRTRSLALAEAGNSSIEVPQSTRSSRTATIQGDRIAVPTNQGGVGIIILSIVSFSADSAVASVFFLRSFLQQFFKAPQYPDPLAEAHANKSNFCFFFFLDAVGHPPWLVAEQLKLIWVHDSMLFGSENVSNFTCHTLRRPLHFREE
jgi:hypothetical protein